MLASPVPLTLAQVSTLYSPPLAATTLARIDSVIEALMMVAIERDWALWLLRRGTIEEKGLALTGLLGVVAYAGIFLYTNWRPEVQIPNAFPRLLVHIAPIAAVVVVAGYRRAFHSKSDSLL